MAGMQQYRLTGLDEVNVTNPWSQFEPVLSVPKYLYRQKPSPRPICSRFTNVDRNIVDENQDPNITKSGGNHTGKRLTLDEEDDVRCVGLFESMELDEERLVIRPLNSMAHIHDTPKMRRRIVNGDRNTVRKDIDCESPRIRRQSSLIITETPKMKLLRRKPSFAVEYRCTQSKHSADDVVTDFDRMRYQETRQEKQSQSPTKQEWSRLHLSIYDWNWFAGNVSD